MAKRLGSRIALSLAVCVIFCVSPIMAQTRPETPQLRQPESVDPSHANVSPNGATLPNGAPIQPKQIAVQPPFVLTPPQQAELDQLLADWEKNNSNIRQFKCTFTRWEYDPTFISDPKQPKTESHGELKYAAPDKGLFHVTEAKEFVLDPKTNEYKAVALEPTEYWTCDGKSMYQVDAKKKQIIEQPIPPELQGKSITEGPLPFVFGAKADTLRRRYFMQLVTPPNGVKDQVWLEARPKMQKDAANFASVRLILSKPDLQPTAIEITNPGADPKNPSRTVITLENPSINNPWAPIQQLFSDFARPNILGYKHVIEQTQVPPPSSPQTPQGTTPLEQAGRSKSPPR